MLGQHCSDREQRAEAAERELTKLKLLAYLSRADRRRNGRRGHRRGELRAVRAKASNCRPKGLIHADALSDDYYCFDRATHTLAGRRSGKSYRLGDLLRVAVARVDLERRELDFRLVERKKTSRKR